MNNFREYISLLKILDNSESCLTLSRLNWLRENEIAVIKSMIPILEEVYPNEWDIQLMVKESITPHISAVIHFPEIHITNSDKHHHVIHDIYVSIPIFSNHSDKITTFLGARTRASYGEFLSSYRHSHLESGFYDTLKFTHFCLGEGEIVQTMLLYSNTGDLAFFKLLLIQLESYLSWESLEGGPHIRLTSVFARGASSNIPVIKADEISSMLINNVRTNHVDLSSLDLQLSSDGYISIVDNEAFESFIGGLSRYTPDYLCYKDDEGNYCGSVRDINRFSNLTKATISFRGENIPFTVDFNIPESNSPRYVHPQLKKHLKNKFEYELNKRKIKATAFK